LIPNCCVPLWIIFQGKVLGEIAFVGQIVDDIWAGGKLGEVTVEIGDKIGVEGNGFVPSVLLASVRESSKAEKLMLSNNDCAGILDYSDCSFESIKVW
jgi:hypothetical protein